jgi:hypothetical protein
MECEIPYNAGIEDIKFGSSRCKKKVGTSCSDDEECIYWENTDVFGGPPNACINGTCQPRFREFGESCQMKERAESRPITFVTAKLRDDWCAEGLTCDAFSKTCLKDIGTACSEDAECISPSGCISLGICATSDCALHEGDPCNASDSGDCRQGTTTCDGNTMHCMGGMPSEEVCDGRDNDCDNRVDEMDNEEIESETGGPCAVEMGNGVSCQEGFEVPGELECQNGQLTCVPHFCSELDPGEKKCVCRSPGAAIVGDGEDVLPLLGLPCGTPGATPCNPDFEHCAPNSVCATSPGIGEPGQELCNEDPQCLQPDPICWTPEQLKTGLNCYLGEDIGLPNDADGDGIIDFSDACIMEKGPPSARADYTGCPDGDEDGVPDDFDACPTQTAHTFSGCPL